MKLPFKVLPVLFLTAAAVMATPQELKIIVELTVGEKSKDSSSLTTRIWVDDSKLGWEQTANGARARGKTPRPAKEFQLSVREKENLLELIRAHDMLATDSLEIPQRPPVFYFELRVETRNGIEKGAVTISGPRSAVELQEKVLYRNSLALVKELYRLMQTHDKSIVFEEPVRERP